MVCPLFSSFWLLCLCFDFHGCPSIPIDFQACCRQKVCRDRTQDETGVLAPKQGMLHFLLNVMDFNLCSSIVVDVRHFLQIPNRCSLICIDVQGCHSQAIRRDIAGDERGVLGPIQGPLQSPRSNNARLEAGIKFPAMFIDLVFFIGVR